LPGTASTFVGPEGGAAGTMGSEAADPVLVPAQLVAVTVNV
jgi:hypothetical protein